MRSITPVERALATLRAMQADHPGKIYPTIYVYPQEVRDAANVLAAEIIRLRGKLWENLT